MPYIKIERRRALDPIIDGLVKRLDTPGNTKREVSYALIRLVIETLNADTYDSLSECVSVLRDTADEIQRRLLTPYNKFLKQVNGDLECFQTDYAEE